MSLCLVITGASGELGRRVVDASISTANVGRVVAITSRPEQLSFVSEKLSIVDSVDLADAYGAGAELLRSSIDYHGVSSVALIHCSGAFRAPCPLHKIDLADIRLDLEANLLSFLGAVALLLPAMHKRKSGRIIAFTSHTQSFCYPFSGSFNLGKAALLSAVQTLANENARFGVTANAIAIATMQTETERRFKPAGVYEDWVPPLSLAKYAVDLACSKDDYVNGNEIHYWKYSRSFFGTSVFTRNSIEENV